MKVAFVYTNPRSKGAKPAAISIAENSEGKAFIVQGWEGPLSGLGEAIQYTEADKWVIAQEELRGAIQEHHSKARVEVKPLDLASLTRRFFSLKDEGLIVAGQWRPWVHLIAAVEESRFTPRWIACLGALMAAAKPESYIIQGARFIEPKRLLLYDESSTQQRGSGPYGRTMIQDIFGPDPRHSKRSHRPTNLF
ncbi:MAG: hypothetical protein AAFO06_04535 [Cyanobacteria bacterium J06597_16]